MIADVSENVSRGTFVAEILTRSRSTVRYSVTGGNDDNLFVVNPSTGLVITNNELDFEEARMHNLTVVVSNLVGQSVTCNVLVNVLDVNDNPPEFTSRTYRGSVSESASIGSLVLAHDLISPLVIVAEDPDVGINALLTYKIEDNLARKYFAIDDSSGAVRTIATLDYEEIMVFEFAVTVRDHGKPTLSSGMAAKVVIDILDDNDSPPTFVQKEYSELLLLPTFNDVVVLRVNASDNDVSTKNPLSFRITGGNRKGLFKLNETTGEVLVADSSRLISHSMHALDLTVTDGKFSDRCIVHVQVEEADHSGLAFSRSTYEAKVLENSTKSDLILVLTVLGSALNENLHFSILNPTDYFTVRFRTHQETL